MRKLTGHRNGNKVDQTSQDSFPASDPPSWTPETGTGSPNRPNPNRVIEKKEPGIFDKLVKAFEIVW